METEQQSWWIRFIKGMFIGSGFIIPGISGGALAAIFGLYERIIRFLANIRDHFLENVRFFIPVGLGALLGIAILSWGVSYLLGNYETIILWFFVGAILGTAPALWQEAGLEGRSNLDIAILAVSFVGGLILLQAGRQIAGNLQPSFFAWMLCGGLIALGILIPGLSPSNFIVYLGLYQAMADGFKRLDLGVIIPIGIGGFVTIFLLAKAINYIFDHYYSQFFHFIFGIVMASTVMIIPEQSAFVGFGFIEYAMCVVMLLTGSGVGRWMANLEARYT